MDSRLNIIVVEDHDVLREVTVEALRAMGHDARGADCAEALDDELAGFRADLMVLDLGLPGEDGISLARRIRAAQPEIGIIMVTARHQRQDVLVGYGSGADIYLVKPTSPEELGAAIQALSRRMRSTTPDGQLALHEATLTLKGPEAEVDLSDHECSLLIALCRASGNRLETWQMLEISGRPADEHGKRALEVQIVRLRKKLDQSGAGGPSIKSIRGSGYQLCVPISIH